MNWIQAFARQAASDLAAYDTLVGEKSLPACHWLQHLQMACEKICKASLMEMGADPLQIQESHAYIAKQLPIIVRLYLSRDAGQIQKERWLVDAIRPLARMIELLTPAVRDGGRSPQNCEYPWQLPSGDVMPPADYKFDTRAIRERPGITLLKVLRRVSVELQK